MLRGVIAQRLVRQLCERCKTARPLVAADFTEDPRLAALGFRAGEIVQEPCGCERCGGTGYRGRLGAFELLELSNELRELIGERTDGLKIDTMAIRGGHDHDARRRRRQVPRRIDLARRNPPRVATVR